jgi:hypothetical protein
MSQGAEVLRVETTIYYTLSTISQTLAGSLAILAAFLAIRVSSLDATVRQALSELDRRAGGDNTEARATGGLREELKAWQRWLDGQQGVAHSHRVLATANQVQAAKDAVLDEARKVFVASTCVMVGCFIGLALAPSIAGSPFRTVSALVLTIGGGVGCLVWYGLMLGRTLRG